MVPSLFSILLLSPPITEAFFRLSKHCSNYNVHVHNRKMSQIDVVTLFSRSLFNLSVLDISHGLCLSHILPFASVKM